MNHACLIFLFCVYMILSSSLCLAETPWELFLTHPTAENANSVIQIEYTDAGAINYLSRDLDIMSDRIEMGDKDAFDMAFRILANSDGQVAEDLCIVIGRGIAPRPEIFLAALSSSGFQTEHRHLLTCILGNPGWAYVDRPFARIAEMTERVQVLETVTDSTLQEVRDLCLSELNRQIELSPP